MFAFFPLALCGVAFALQVGEVASASENAAESDVVTMIVMDPLAAPLSCPCVEGYAQRKYEALAAHLEKESGREVRLVFAEALSAALEGEARGRADLIIGKDSVVRADVKKAKLTADPIARLTGKDGSTTQTGLIVVARDAPAQVVGDLNNYQIVFGPAECDEKHRSALALLSSAGVAPPERLAIDQACSSGASQVVEKGPEAAMAAVISSYAAPLLEGCGTIKKGDLRVVGETAPVPFVTAFATNAVDPKLRKRLQAALLATGEEPDVLIALESLMGFVPLESRDEVSSNKSVTTAAEAPAKKKT